MYELNNYETLKSETILIIINGLSIQKIPI